MSIFNENIFNVQKPKITLPEHSKVIFVADLFAEHYTGGAELTTEALIEECPLPYAKILSRDIDLDV